LCHQRALAAIAVAAAAENRDQSPLAERAQRLEQLQYRVRGVGVVDDYAGRSGDVCLDAFDAPRNLRAIRDACFDRVAPDASGDRHAARHQQVLDVEVADQRRVELEFADRRRDGCVRAVERDVGVREPNLGVGRRVARHPDQL